MLKNYSKKYLFYLIAVWEPKEEKYASVFVENPQGVALSQILRNCILGTQSPKVVC